MDIQMNNLKKNYNLVVNGCSYMEVYARGQGHVDLANRLNITNTCLLYTSDAADE